MIEIIFKIWVIYLLYKIIEIVTPKQDGTS